jgi:hypothetical protein
VRSFSDPDVATRLPEWGKSLTILSEGEKRFLSSQEPAFVTASKKVDFPENFILDFEVKGDFKYWNTMKFVDGSNNEFELDFQLYDGNCYIVLPGPKSVKVPTNTLLPNRFRLARKDGFYEVYLNDSLALAGPYTKYTAFKGFSIVARLDQVHFTGFQGQPIKE